MNPEYDFFLGRDQGAMDDLLVGITGLNRFLDASVSVIGKTFQNVVTGFASYTDMQNSLEVVTKGLQINSVQFLDPASEFHKHVIDNIYASDKGHIVEKTADGFAVRIIPTPSDVSVAFLRPQHDRFEHLETYFNTVLTGKETIETYKEKWVKILHLDSMIQEEQQSLSDFFEVPFDKKTSLSLHREVRVPLDFDLAELFGRFIFGEHAPSSLSQNVISRFSKYVDLSITLVPNSHVVQDIMERNRAERRKEEGKFVPENRFKWVEDIPACHLIPGARIRVFPVFKFSKEFVSEVTQSEIPNWSAFLFWVQAWTKFKFKNKRKFSGKVTPVSSIISGLKKDSAGHIDTKADDSGLHISSTGYFRYMPRASAINMSSAMIYESLMEDMLHMCIQTGRSLPSLSNAHPSLSITSGDDSIVDEVKATLNRMAILSSVPLAVDWNAGVGVHVNVHTPTRITGIDLNGSARPTALSVADAIHGSAERNLELFLGAIPQAKGEIRRLYGNGIPVDQLSGLGQLLAFLCFHGRLSRVSDYMKQAAEILGKEDGIGEMDYEYRLPLGIQNGRYISVDGLSFADQCEDMTSDEVATSLLRKYQPLLKKCQNEDETLILHFFGEFQAFIELWCDLKSFTSGSRLKGWIQDTCPGTDEADTPFYFRPDESPVFEMANLNNLVVGRAFSLLLRACLSEIESPDSVLFSSNDTCPKPIFGSIPFLPDFSAISTRLIPFVSLVGAYLYDHEQYLKDGEFERERINPGADEIAPAIPGSSGLYLFPHQYHAYQYSAQEPESIIFDVAAGGGKCAVGSTLVPTKDGILTLEEMWHRSNPHINQEGFREIEVDVLSVEGVSKATHTYQTSGNTYEVLFSDGSTFESLPEHRIWTYTGEGFGFIHVGNLVPGTPVPKSLGSNMFPSTSASFQEVNLSRYSDHVVQDFESKGLSLPESLSSELAMLLGLLVAEGYIPEKYKRVEFSNACPEILSLYTRNVESVFGPCVQVTESKDRAPCLRIDNLIVKDFLRSLIDPGLSADRNVPLCIRTSTKEHQLAFLRGYFEGDGSVYKETDVDRWYIEATTISKDLAMQLRALLENIGINTSIRERGTWATNGSSSQVSKESYTVNILPQSFYLFASEVSFLSTKKLGLLDACIQHFKWILFESKQYTNFFIHGSHNKVPAGQHLETLMQIVEEVASTVSYQVPKNEKGGGGRTETYTLSWLWRNCGFRNQKYGVNKDGWTNRYSIHQCIRLIESAPEEIRVKLERSPGFQYLMPEIHRLSSYAWVRVSDVRETSRVLPVYDLHVPETNNYAMNGMFGHNTISGIIDVLSLMGKGKVKKPLIIAPNDLVTNWIDDLSMVTRGRFNTIPIITSSMKRWESSDIVPLIDMIQNAPPNTIFLTSYSFLANRDADTDVIVIDNIVRPIFPNVEFIRKIGVDYIGIDESHFIKNVDSARSQAVSILAFDPNIRYKRLFSGSIVTDKPTDIVGQTKIVDPTIFRNVDAFLKEFSIQGDAINLSASAIRDVRRRLQSRVATVTFKRRDWAFMLPVPQETFIRAEMSENFQTVYDVILSQQLEELQKAIKSHKTLWNRDFDDLSSEDENALAALLDKFVLLRLEQFIHDPMGDPVGAKMFSEMGDPGKPPKVAKIEERLEEHFAKDQNKVVIFSRYKRGAASTLKHFDAKWQKCALYYDAMHKGNYQRFLDDPEIKILVAVEQSINTGRNIQAASRLIRIDTVWTPGELDQGASRFFRPDVSNRYNRDMIHLDWVIVDGSVEVVKLGRLISKILKKAAFDETDNPTYASLPDLPPFAMNLDTLQTIRRFEDINVYMSAYLDIYSPIVQEEFMQAKQKDDSKFRPVPDQEPLPGSAFPEYFPYMENQRIILQNGVETVRFNEFISGFEDVADDELLRTFVVTEVGAGRIEKINRSRKDGSLTSVRVKVVGRKKMATVSPALLHVAVNVPDDALHLFTLDKSQPVQEVKTRPLGTRLHDYDWYLNINADMTVTTKNGTIKIGEGCQFGTIEREDGKSFLFITPTMTKPCVFTKKAVNQIVEQTGQQKTEGNSNAVVHIKPININGENVWILKGANSASDIVHMVNAFVFIPVRSSAQWNAIFSWLSTNFTISNLDDVQRTQGCFIDDEFSMDAFSALNCENFFGMQHNVSADWNTISVHPIVKNGVFYFAIDVDTNPATERIHGREVPICGKGCVWKTSNKQYVCFVAERSSATRLLKTIGSEMRIKNLNGLRNRIRRM